MPRPFLFCTLLIVTALLAGCRERSASADPANAEVLEQAPPTPTRQETPRAQSAAPRRATPQTQPTPTEAARPLAAPKRPSAETLPVRPAPARERPSAPSQKAAEATSREPAPSETAAAAEARGGGAAPSPAAAPAAPTPTAPAPTESAPQAPAAPRRAQAQLRGLWVDAFGPGFKTPQEVDQLVADARALRVNALFVQVGKRGDCYCTHASMPRTDDPAVPAGFDPLQDVIEKAHAANLQVHAWIITTAVVNVAENPTPSAPDHVFNTHGLSATGRDAWLTRSVGGDARAGNDYVLDPGHPDAAAYIAEMYASVARNYDVDGVQLDRVRYPDAGGLPAWGYNDTALARYRAETGAGGIPAPTDEAWKAWRREQVTNLVRRIYLAVKSVKSDVAVSAATITYGAGPRTLQDFAASRTYNEVLQDWPTWAREGYFDLNVLMNYKREDVPDQARAYREWNEFAVKYKGARLVAAGSAMYLNTLPATLRQASSALADGLDGWVGYSYRTSDASVNAGQRTSAQAVPDLTARFVRAGGPFQRPETWTRPDASTLRAVQGRLESETGPLGGRAVELRVNGRAFARTKTDGGGLYGFVFTPPTPFEVVVDGASAFTAEARAGEVVELPTMQLP